MVAYDAPIGETTQISGFLCLQILEKWANLPLLLNVQSCFSFAGGWPCWSGAVSLDLAVSSAADLCYRVVPHALTMPLCPPWLQILTNRRWKGLTACHTKQTLGWRLVNSLVIINHNLNFTIELQSFARIAWWLWYLYVYSAFQGIF